MTDSGITKEYLENVLGTAIEKFEVKAGSEVGDGKLSAQFKVEIWKQSAPENPIGIVIKCYPATQAGQDMLEITSVGIFQVELGMYDTVIPALRKFQEIVQQKDRVSLPFAPFIYGRFIKAEDRPKLGRPFNRLDNSIIMPDLRRLENGPFILRDRFLGFDLDHYVLVIEALAKLHAVSWAYKCRNCRKSLLEDFPIFAGNVGVGEGFEGALRECDPTSYDINTKLFQDNPKILEGLAHLRSVAYSVWGLYYDYDAGQTAKGHTKDNVLRKHGKELEDEEPWTVLLHGDCWSNNLMFRYDEKTGKPVEVIFIDLQLSRESDPMFDISYGLYYNAQPDLRRKHLQSILHIYFDTFTQICKKFDVPPLPGWSWEEFNRRFHRAKIFAGLFTAVFLHVSHKSTDGQQNLDEMMEKAEVSSDGKRGAMDGFGAAISAGISDKIHPAIKHRLSAVLEDLTDEGVL